LSECSSEASTLITSATVIADGEVIEERPDDFPLPSCLLLFPLYGAPVHVVLAIDTEDGRCHTISVYWPENDRWDIEFRTRRR